MREWMNAQMYVRVSRYGSGRVRGREREDKREGGSKVTES